MFHAIVGTLGTVFLTVLLIQISRVRTKIVDFHRTEDGHLFLLLQNRSYLSTITTRVKPYPDKWSEFEKVGGYVGIQRLPYLYPSRPKERLGDVLKYRVELTPRDMTVLSTRAHSEQAAKSFPPFEAMEDIDYPIYLFVEQTGEIYKIDGACKNIKKWRRVPRVKATNGGLEISPHVQLEPGRLSLKTLIDWPENAIMRSVDKLTGHYRSNKSGETKL